MDNFIFNNDVQFPGTTTLEDDAYTGNNGSDTWVGTGDDDIYTGGDGSDTLWFGNSVDVSPDGFGNTTSVDDQYLQDTMTAQDIMF